MILIIEHRLGNKMRISEKRSAAVYNAICEPIMELRVSSIQGKLNLEEMDEKLYELEQKIANNIAKELNLQIK